MTWPGDRDGIGAGVGRALQGLADDAVSTDLRTEKAGGNVGDVLLGIGERVGRGHGRRGADALEVRCLAGVPQSADEESDVSSLTASVGVQLVKSEEA